MKVRIPILVQDRLSSKIAGTALTAGRDFTDEKFWLDGPVTERVAILDFDPDTGSLQPGAKFLPPAKSNKIGKYDIANTQDLSNPHLHQVVVFGAVKEAMRMFEEPDVLGRRIVWAFNSPQLLVIPRAGKWENAYYERDSHSLQFFYFRHPHQPDFTVYTSLSRDIVAHETGHAILDGIAPHLYNAITPQSLALHEGVADLVALITAFRSKKLVLKVLKPPDGSIQSSTAFSTLAEEFGSALSDTGLVGYLRDLYNQKTLDPSDEVNYVHRTEPHALCEVLTGALYTIMVKLHEEKTAEIAKAENKSLFSASGKALAFSADQFKRMILRALDYLPPGEVSFADYGRAILAADEAFYPNNTRERIWLIDEFTRRKIVTMQDALKVQTNITKPELANLDLQTIWDSDWAAYQFVNDHRNLFFIPNGIPFQILPRLKSTKKYFKNGREEYVSELLFKVWWHIEENNKLGSRFAKKRLLTVGTTLAIDWQTKQMRVRLTSDRAMNPAEETEQRKDRDQFLDSLAQQGILQTGNYTNGPDGLPLKSVVYADDINGVMMMHGTARTLHIIGRS